MSARFQIIRMSILPSKKLKTLFSKAYRYFLITNEDTNLRVAYTHKKYIFIMSNQGPAEFQTE